MKKKTGRKILIVLLMLAMVVGLLPVSNMTALAAKAYGSYVNTTTAVKFNNIEWYIIEDNSSAIDAGTVTLLAKNPLSGGKYQNIEADQLTETEAHNAYNTSAVKAYLDALTAENGSFANVAGAIKTVSGLKTYNFYYADESPSEVVETVNNVKLYLLSREEVKQLPENIRKCAQAAGADYNKWWTRSPGTPGINGRRQTVGYVNGATGFHAFGGDPVQYKNGYRPALQLDLSKVDFNAENKTFTLKQIVVTGVTLNKSSTTLAVGGTETLAATVSPDNATNKSVTWSSDNENVATVNTNGVVSAVAAGTATITVTTTNGSKTATCTVTVESPHTHSFTYSASGATVTATCSAAECTLTDSKATLTLNANNAAYTGSAYSGASLDSTTWAAAGLTVPPIEYAGRGSTSYPKSTTAPTDAGDYTASVTVDTDKIASVDFSISKADPTAAAPSLTAAYGQTLADLTLTNPSGNTEGTWSWAVDESTSVGSVGTHTFKANFTPTDTTNYNSKTNVDVTVTVGKAANPATVTGTAAVMKGGNTVDLADNVTLNGATGEVTYEISGEANGCSLNGSVLTSGDNTGELTVNVTVAEDGNYTALTATPITVTVTDKQTQTITADNITATYGDTGKSVEATLTAGNGTLSYAVKEGDAVTVDAETGALTIAKAGTAVVTVTASETKGYAKAEKDITVTTERKPITVKAKDQSIYTGETVPSLTSPVLDTHYTVTGLVGSDALTTPPTLSYKKDGSAAEPDNSKAGSYDIVPDGASAGDNYTISYQNGKLTVEDATFYVADGDKQKYKKSDLTFTFKMKGDDSNTFKYLDNFKKAAIKGPNIDRDLKPDEYIAANGSLKLTLKKSLLSTLKAGTYTVTVYFIDEAAAHSASATFTVPSRSGGVDTGDDTKANNIVSAMILFFLSLSFMTYIVHTDEQLRAKLLAVPAGISSFFNTKATAALDAPETDTVIDEPEDIVFYDAALESASVSEDLAAEQYESDSFDEDLETEDTDDGFDEDLESESTDDGFDDDLDSDSVDSYDDLEAKLNELEAKLTELEDDFDL